MAKEENESFGEIGRPSFVLICWRCNQGGLSLKKSCKNGGGQEKKRGYPKTWNAPMWEAEKI